MSPTAPVNDARFLSDSMPPRTMAATTPITAITTTSSTSVKPQEPRAGAVSHLNVKRFVSIRQPGGLGESLWVLRPPVARGLLLSRIRPHSLPGYRNPHAAIFGGAIADKRAVLFKSGGSPLPLGSVTFSSLRECSALAEDVGKPAQG